MDLRTGQMYRTKEEALAAGVPEHDLAYMVMSPERVAMLDELKAAIPLHEMVGPDPKVEFSKHVFGSFKNIEPAKK